MSAGSTQDIDIEHLREWVGQEQVVVDDMSPFKAEALAAALDYPTHEPLLSDGVELPVAWQWLYFLDKPRAAETGGDGHRKTGTFLPPVPLPRRMWAAGKFQMKHPVILGTVAQKRSVVANVDLKRGKTGALVFVVVQHTLSQSGNDCIVEEQTIVYRAMPEGPSPLPAGRLASKDFDWCYKIEPSPVLLFRFSALTYNAHRIHYDRQYALEAEHYPALVVHSPLQAILLAGKAAEQDGELRVEELTFRAQRPLFDTHPFHVCGQRNGDEVRLWTQDHEGFIATTANAKLVYNTR